MANKYLLIKCVVLLPLLFTSCQKKGSETVGASTQSIALFTLLSPTQTGLNFSNEVKETLQLNGLFHDYYYNGAGVAVGDVNGDQLPDIYFVSNLDTNRLYLNLGNMQFKEVTQVAGVWGGLGYHTGASMVDINADGLLDIYLCKSGSFTQEFTTNALYLNQGINDRGIPTFVEAAAQFNIDVPFTTTQAAFFDYDLDGDLDVFFSNYGFKPYNNQDLAAFSQRRAELWGDRLFRNDAIPPAGKPKGTFVDVSEKAGMINTLIGDGLGVGIGDLNNDGWPDIYLCSDFSDKDHFYLNNQDGTFTEVGNLATKHSSTYSMGNDMADINNDGWLDIVELDMVSEDNYGIKTSMSAMNPELFQLHVDLGLHHQYMYNSLQLNNGIGPNGNYPLFSEMAQLAGISSTDWSWAPLLVDLDNDGWKDLFVTNGIKRDFRNNDYVAYKKQRQQELMQAKGGQNDPALVQQYIEDALKNMPHRKKRNYFFKNQGNLQFANVSEIWATGDLENFAQGAAYADFDLDGDIDIVTNNTDEAATIYQNNANELVRHHYLQIALKGPKLNPQGIGTRVAIFQNGTKQINECYPVRGYQSAVDPILHFGLGNKALIDSLLVTWPDGKVQKLEKISSNQRITIAHTASSFLNAENKLAPTLVEDKTKQSGLIHRHLENHYNDFDREGLLPHKMSEFGPALATGDINGDALEDCFIGGAAGFEPAIYLQTEGGRFVLFPSTTLANDRMHEDVGATLFDADGDHDLDLYVVSGGNEFPAGDAFYQDRLYLNDGMGNFKKVEALPKFYSSGSKVCPADYDQDGDLDLFVAGRLNPRNYPKPASSSILRNDTKGTNIQFTDVSKIIAPDLENIGLVTDAQWADITGDGALDLILVGEWMPITILENQNNHFKRFDPIPPILTGQIPNKSTNHPPNHHGWWYSVKALDFDQDGDLDIIAGNLGLNYKYKASEAAPFEVYAKDFDENGSQDIALAYYNEDQLYPLRGRECSSQQVPEIKQKFPTYDAFGKATLSQVYGDMGLEKAIHYQATTFASTYFENLGSGTFAAKRLPNLAQLSAVNVILTPDLNKDGFPDLILAGNLYQSEVETPRNDASYGLILLNDQHGFFEVVSPQQSGLYVEGDVKAASIVKLQSGQLAWLFAKNDDFIQLITEKSPSQNN